MYKKCIMLLCLFTFEVKSDCDGYFGCFNDFFKNFFVENNTTSIQYANTTIGNLPEEFAQVQQVQTSELNKVVSEISSFIQEDIAKQLKLQSNNALFKNVNENTKIYVKTFNYNEEYRNEFIPNFEIVPEIIGKSEGNDNRIIIENRFSVSQDIIQNSTQNRESETTQSVPELVFINKTKNDEPSTIKVTPGPDAQIATKIQELKISPKQKDIRENEIPKTDDVMFSYYDSVEDNATDYPIIDYVDLYKDTTNEENIFDPSEVSTVTYIKDDIQEKVEEYSLEIGTNNSDNSCFGNDTCDVTSIYPWISTIFLKNDTNKYQFNYFCDGALLNEKLLITAARCVNNDNSTVDVNSLLIILGKTSLLSTKEDEKMVKVKKIITHENFTNWNDKVEHDLAILVLEEPVVFNDAIQPAVLGNYTDDGEAMDLSVSTAWNLQGELTPVFMDTKNAVCPDKDVAENTFCATYGNDVALCPSYGGVYATRQSSRWNIRAIRTGDVTDTGICFDKRLVYTKLSDYEDWIMNLIVISDE